MYLGAKRRYINTLPFLSFSVQLQEQFQPSIERVQALADISRSALCCDGNETRAPIANPPNGAQLEDTPYHAS